MLALAAHVGLILWLGERSPIVPRPPGHSTTLELTPPGAEDLLALTDPTLFALPHRESFSGPAWVTIHARPAQPFVWTEPPSWLSLAVAHLGPPRHMTPLEDLADFAPIQPPPQPALFLPIEEKSTAFPDHSTWWVTGELAGRRLLTPLELPPQHYSDVLTNSVVQVVVGPEGVPLFPPTLLSRSGKPEADAYALEKSGAARFEPLGSFDSTTTNLVAHLMWGQIVFAWHTLPLPATNKPAGNGP